MHQRTLQQTRESMESMLAFFVEMGYFDVHISAVSLNSQFTISSQPGQAGTKKAE